VRQVGYLQRLYPDVRSTEHKILQVNVATNSASRTSFVPRSYKELGLSTQYIQYSDIFLTKHAGLRCNLSDLLSEMLPFPIPAGTQPIQFSELPL
jgi:hypothetical protein